MSYYADDVRRIASQGKLKTGVSARDPREPIPATITPFIDSIFAPTAAESKAAGDSNDDTNNEAPVQNPDDPNSFLEPPGSGGSSKSGSTSVDDQFDNPPTTNDEAGNEAGSEEGGAVKQITDFEDCVNGDCFNIQYDGRFNPPAGWTGPDSPPDDPDWELGFYWDATTISFVVRGGADEPGAPQPNPKQAPTAGAILNPWNAAMVPWAASSEFDSWYIRPYKSYTTATEVRWKGTKSGAIGTSDWKVIVTKKNCSGSAYESDDAVCPATAPPVNDGFWPDDGCYDVALVDGQYTTHERDPNAPASGFPKSTIDWCSPGGKQGKTSAAKDGGWCIWQTTGTTKAIYCYNADGSLKAAGDATQTFIDQYIPK